MPADPREARPALRVAAAIAAALLIGGGLLAAWLQPALAAFVVWPLLFVLDRKSVV